MKIEAVIFDLDGTLIDSVRIYFKIAQEILKRVHLPAVSREVVSELMRGGQEGWLRLIPARMSGRRDGLLEKIMEAVKEIGWKIFQDEVDVISGVPEIFSYLSEKNIRIGVVSSTHEKFMEGKLLPLRKNGLGGQIEALIGIEDAPKMKPEPDPLLECARRLGVETEKCVYVGDSYEDIIAGKRAKMMTIGVLTGLDDYETLNREEPSMIMSSVYELKSALCRLC
jgi:beta-phosphoglucomutase-like phosphatase (HAD superfamily)